MQGARALDENDVPDSTLVVPTHHQHLLACDNISVAVRPSPLRNPLLDWCFSQNTHTLRLQSAISSPDGYPATPRITTHYINRVGTTNRSILHSHVSLFDRKLGQS
jgi:hypothetical protein